MKRLLRGVIDFGGATQDALRSNYLRLADAPIQWAQPEDEKIYRFVKEFFDAHLELPSGQMLAEYYERANDFGCVERLKDIQSAALYERANFSHIIKELVDTQTRINLHALLKEASEINTKGIDVGKGKDKVRRKGPEDAVAHLASRMYSVLPQVSGARTKGDLRDEASAAWEEYEAAERDKGKVFGRFTGLNEIDKVCHGLKRGELWIHAAFAGELKTTYAINWAYNLVTRYRANVLYVSLEMPYEQLRRMVLALHSANPKFAYRAPLDSRAVRDGMLSPEDKAFYQEVLKDWDTNPNYCRFKVWCPDREINIDDIRQYAEVLHKEMDVGFLVVDHAGLLAAKRKFNNYIVEHNTIFRDAKLMALHFAHGEGLPVLLLHQTNRQGRDEAEKNDGVYKAKALSWAHEAERSADGISTTYLDDKHRENGTTLCCCLKNRDNPLFPPTMLQVRKGCRRITNPVIPPRIEDLDLDLEV